MSNIKEDRLDSCQDSFKEKNLQEYLDHVAEILGISRPRYRVKTGTKMGDNYVGIISRIFIEGEKNGEPVKIETVFKLPPQDEAMRQMFSIRHFFLREHVFYSEIVRLLKEFLSAKNKRLENVPECYFSSDVEKKVICLEDLLPKGFLMRDRIKQLDFLHISLAIRALGRLHALSFALRDQRPEIFARKIATLKKTLHRPELITQPGFVYRFEKIGDLVKMALAEEDPKYTERFSQYLKVVLSSIGWSSDESIAEPYAVLGHGDFWINNMLFKYDEELRDKHYDELIKIYHESLSAYLSELGSDPKKLFPYQALLYQLDKFSINGAGMAILALHIFTSKDQDNVTLSPGDSGNSEIHALQERIHRDHFWRNTMRDTFKDLIDRNYI